MNKKRIPYPFYTYQSVKEYTAVIDRTLNPGVQLIFYRLFEVGETFIVVSYIYIYICNPLFTSPFYTVLQDSHLRTECLFTLTQIE